MNLPKTDAAEKRINEILAARKAELDGMDELIREAQEAYEAAREAMDAATDAGDVEAFKRAREAFEDASTALMIHENRLEKLKHGALISKEEYESLVRDIYTEVGALDSQTLETLCTQAEAMEAEGKELLTAGTRANDVLRRLQYDVYRLSDSSYYTKDGEPVATVMDIKAVNVMPTVWMSQGAVNHDAYKAHQKAKGE